MPRDEMARKIAIHVERRKGQDGNLAKKQRAGVQKGFTITRMTIPIIRTVGSSFIIRQ
ncbi:hypothetical protein J2857_005855 [Neorhizobium galegae]|nr:hypothetical protein [Neorhizobium galegae]